MSSGSAPDVTAFLRRSARVAPRAMAVACPQWSIDYSELLGRAERLGALIRQALQSRHCEPVVVVAEHDPHVPELYFGVMMSGHAVVPVSSRLPDEAIARIVAFSGARLGILSPEAAPRLKAIASSADSAAWIAYGSEDFPKLPARDVELPVGTCMVCFTSGTTGEPKGVLMTHLNLVVHGLTSVGFFGMTGRNVTINPMPLAHMAGASRVISTVVNAGAHVLLPGFSTQSLCAAIAQWRGTHIIVVPTMVGDLLASDLERFDLSSLRAFVCGTAPLPMPVARQLVQRMKCGIFNGYGLTESSALAVSLGPEGHLRALAEGNEELLGSIGQPVPGIELRIVDDERRDVVHGQVGQIALRGLKVSPGYYNNPRETAAKFTSDGWLLTGDQGRLIAEDNVVILGRLDDMIISGGLNVQPGEVEREAVLVEGLSQCAAFAVKSERWGQEVRLAVVSKPGAALQPDAIRDFLKTRLDPYKVPKQVHVMDSLPRTAVGKVQRFKLAEQWGTRDEGRSG